MHSKTSIHELGVVLLGIALLLAGWRDCRTIARESVERWKERTEHNAP